MSKENMTAKDFLMQYRTADRIIQLLKSDIERVEGRASGVAQQIDGQPRGSGKSDKVAKAATAAADLKVKLEEKLWDQEAIKRRVFYVLGEIKQSDHVDVLRMRYIEEPPADEWISIACALNKSIRQVQRIHGYALQEVQKIIDGEV